MDLGINVSEGDMVAKSGRASMRQHTNKAGILCLLAGKNTRKVRAGYKVNTFKDSVPIGPDLVKKTTNTGLLQFECACSRHNYRGSVHRG